MIKCNTKQKLWVVLGVVVAAAVGYCQPRRHSVTCPKSTSSASVSANACLAKTRVSLAPSTGISTYAQMKNGCTSGSFVEVVECLKDIIRSCDVENPEISKALRLKHDVDVLGAAIKQVCDNLDTISRSHCSKKKFLEHQVCISQQVTHMQARILHHATERSGGISELFTNLSCEYHYAVLSSCMEKTLREAKCGEAVTSLFLTLPRSTIPPYCNMTINSQNNTIVPATTVSSSTVETKVPMSQNEALKNGVPKSSVQTVNSGKEPIIVRVFISVCLVTLVILENLL